MTAPKDRGSKYRFRKTSSGTKKVHFEEKGKRKMCAITGEKLHGTTSGQKGKVSKESKSQRRPSVPFGGLS